uniref:Catalase n=1 Tax=Ascaris lumbricoides TaxID=6252 RepID=A0A0M3HHR3_ASCLU
MSIMGRVGTESRRNDGYGTQDLTPLSPYGDDSMDELEQHELDDHVGDMPQTFLRRQRRIKVGNACDLLHADIER